MTEPSKPNSTQHLVANVREAVDRARQEREKATRTKALSRANAADYEPAIVSFIDILGFRSLLSSKSAGEIHEIILKLREISTPDDSPSYRMKDTRLTSQAFADSVSDAIVRVRVYETQYSDGAFFHELLDLLHIQIQCIGSGVLIRAGVAIGDIHVGLNGEGPVFGPAMVRAYEIETDEAIFPRIVVDDEAYKQFLTDRRLQKDGHNAEDEVAYVSRLLRIGEDGTRYVDYLGAAESEFDDFGLYLQFLETHAQIARSNLGLSHKPAVHRKYVWLARYHNEIVSKLRGRFDRSDGAAEAFEAAYGVDPDTYFKGLSVAA